MSELHTEARVEGKVKWFNDQKGYGFIARDEAGDVFVHHSAITMEGFRTLKQGEPVIYELRNSDKGPQAYNVIPMNGNGHGGANGHDAEDA